MGAPITVMETAGEGGPYGMALLAGYCLWRQEGEPVIWDRAWTGPGAAGEDIMATPEECQGYRRYLDWYQEVLPAEALAAQRP